MGKTSFEETAPPSFDGAGTDEDISLVDLWLIVRKNRLWLLAGVLVGVAVAVMYIALANPVYESRATIQVGNVPSPGGNTPVLIEDPSVLSVELVDEYGQKSGDKSDRRVPHLEKRDIKVRNNVLDLVASGYGPEEPRDFLRRIAAKILQRHQEAYANAVDPLRQRLSAIGKQIEILTTQMRELGDLIARLKVSNPTQASLVAIERGHLYANLDQLERDRVALQQQTTAPYVNPTRVIARPTLPEDPVSPKKLVAVVVGIVLGLVLGLLAVFFREFFASVRRASASDNSSGT
jgi:uncharacterized protein involved in exopolysaccharide biosynthesis